MKGAPDAPDAPDARYTRCSIGTSLAAAASMLPLLAVALFVKDAAVGTAIVGVVALSAAHHLVPTAATFAADIAAQLALVVAVLHSSGNRGAAGAALALLATWVVVAVALPFRCDGQTTTRVAWAMMSLYAAVLWAVWPGKRGRRAWAWPAIVCIATTAVVGNTVPQATVVAWPLTHLFGAALLWSLLGAR